MIRTVRISFVNLGQWLENIFKIAIHVQQYTAALRVEGNCTVILLAENLQEDNLFYDPADTWTEVFAPTGATEPMAYHDATPASSR